MTKQKITTLEVLQTEEEEDFDGLIEIIEASAVMKKVVLDGSHFTATQEVGEIFVEMVEALKVACETKGIELWRENFPTINGKVDLDAEE
jgi:hypothetical protein